MVSLSPLAQNLDALLTVAERLGGKLSKNPDPGQEERELEHLFVRVKNGSVSFEKKSLFSWINRLLQPKESYDIELSFSKLNRLFEAIQGVDRADLQKALVALQARGEHKTTTDPVESLLMCKYRLNAILKHVAMKRKTNHLDKIQISWAPARSSISWAQSIISKATPAAPNLKAEPKKSALATKRRVLTDKSKTPDWAQEVPGRSLEDLQAAKKAGREFSEPKVLKRLMYEYALVMLRGVGDEKEATKALQKLTQSQKKEMKMYYRDSEFKKEFERLLTVTKKELQVFDKAMDAL